MLVSLQIGKILIGLWIFIAAWVFGYTNVTGAVLSNIVIGTLLILMGGANLHRIQQKRPLIGTTVRKI